MPAIILIRTLVILFQPEVRDWVWGWGRERERRGIEGREGYKWVKGALYTGLKYSVWKGRQGLGVGD